MKQLARLFELEEQEVTQLPYFESNSKVRLDLIELEKSQDSQLLSPHEFREVLAFIEIKKEEFAKLPFFEFLRDTSIEPRQRMAFAPCFAHFAMGFGDLNNHVWREEPTNDPIQSLINQHTYEDDGHWIWFLEDMQELEFDLSLNLSDSLKFLWSSETKIVRHVVYELYRHSYQAIPIKKLIIIETIEAIGDIFLSTTTEVTQELKVITGRKYRYFGSHHFLIDSNHSIYSSEVEEYIASLQLTTFDFKETCEIIDNVFKLFTNLVNELVIYAHQHKLK